MVRVREQFNSRDCEIYGMGEKGYIFSSKCKASVQVRIIERPLRTKSGAEYIVSQKEFALVVCNDFDKDVEFETLENVDSYNAALDFGLKSEDHDYVLYDITPERIELDGDWTFRISDRDGEKLCNLYKEAHGVF